MEKILVVAPHPDDETLGAGATIFKHSKDGDEIYWCIVTKPYTPDWNKEFISKRKKEITEVGQLYGFKKIFELGLPTVKLDLMGQKKVNDALAQVIKEIKPNIVYAPHPGDLNCDHKIVFNAVMVALRPSRDWEIKKILCYETLSETEWGGYSVGRAFLPNYYVNAKPTFDLKMKAMQFYASEIDPPPHPRSLEVIKANAIKRGSECGLLMAEAFHSIRIVER